MANSILAILHQPLNDNISSRVTVLGLEGIKPLDALHIACSEEAGCDYFLTCDDRLVRRYAGSLGVINPVAFVLQITGDGK